MDDVDIACRKPRAGKARAGPCSLGQCGRDQTAMNGKADVEPFAASAQNPAGQVDIVADAQRLHQPASDLMDAGRWAEQRCGIKSDA